MKRKFLTSSLIALAGLSLIGCAGTNKFNVDSKKGITYITIPNELNPSEELPKILQDAGFTETKTESDHSITYSIPDDSYDTFIAETFQSILDYIEVINNSDEYSSISNVGLSANVGTITATINTENYEDSDEELALNALALKVLHYKAYLGEDLSVKIKLYDIETNEVYDTITIEQ